MSCKFYRKGFPEGQDIIKGAIPLSLRREVWERETGLVGIHHSTSLFMYSLYNPLWWFSK